MRILIFTLPFFVLAFFFAQKLALSPIETGLIIALSLLIPWLIFELLQRLIYQKSAQENLLKFYEVLENLVRRLSTLETDMKNKPPKENQEDLAADLRILRALVEQIAHAQQEGASSTEEIVEAEVIDEAQYDQQDHPPESKRQNLTKEQLLKLVEGALKHNRIEMLMQCIVSLPQRKTRHFECFSRLRSEDGAIFNPDHFISLAEEKNLMRVVDNTLLFRCIQMIRAAIKKRFDVMFFLNMSPTTLGDRFFIQSLVDFLESSTEVLEHLIFEFSAQGFRDFDENALKILKRLQGMGCVFSIDQVVDLDFDLRKLRAMNVRYLKMHSSEITSILKQEGGLGKIHQFKLLADQNGLDLVISHVETEDTLREFQDLHFDYGQGYLFGTPALSKQF